MELRQLGELKRTTVCITAFCRHTCVVINGCTAPPCHVFVRSTTSATPPLPCMYPGQQTPQRHTYCKFGRRNMLYTTTLTEHSAGVRYSSAPPLPFILHARQSLQPTLTMHSAGATYSTVPPLPCTLLPDD
eukprot:251469-Pelagomonas_calceolata.AAC.4